VDVDLDELSRAVGREVTAYTAEAIDPEHRLHSVTGGVHRVKGDGFSLIVKIVRNGTDPDPNALWVSGAEPSHRNYWKREWLAYRTGFLDALPGELRAPRTLLTTERSDAECWIWMEDVEGHPGRDWQVADYDSVAFDLATTQAAFATGRAPLPTQSWLSRNWLRGWVETVGHGIDALADEAAWADPVLAEAGTLRSRTRALWEQRERLLEIVEAAPQTVVHLDFWPTNLIAADDGTTVAIDWSQVGIGAIAQDIDQLVLDPVWMQVLPGGPIDDLERHVLRGYLAALRTTWPQVSEADLWRWYAAAASVHYAPLLTGLPSLAADPDRVRRRFAQPVDTVLADRVRVITHALDLGEAVLTGG
jgi:hypothetical protein